MNRLTPFAAVAASVGIVGASLALAASPALAADCSTLSPITSDTTCTLPGTLGSGQTVSLPVTIFGAGGGSGEAGSPYVVGGRGAEVSTTVSLPAGSTITFTQGTGGDMAGGGGGSSALTVGSTLILEAGGGGGSAQGDGSTGDRTKWGGGDAAANNTAAGGDGATACGGKGGNSDGTGAGGAGGTIAGSCEGTAPEFAAAGSAGSSAGAGGTGGNGGTIDPLGGNAGSGYSAGGQVGEQGTGGSYGGPGGGGGYGGGGGGNSSQDPLDSSSVIGGAGGGGSYANTLYTSGTTFTPSTSSYGEGGDDGSGGDGALVIPGEGPIVQTEVSPPTGVSTSGVTVASMANGNGSVADVSVEYSTSATFASVDGTVASSPGTAAVDADTAVSTTLSGLKSCTTYYYRVVAVQVESPQGRAVGAPASFTTTCDPISNVLPLTVKAQGASKKLAKSGTTTVVKSAKTSSKGKLRITVKCSQASKSARGDMSFCNYRTTSGGKITVKTFGYPRVQVKVSIRAVPKTKYKGTIESSSTWTRTWKV